MQDGKIRNGEKKNAFRQSYGRCFGRRPDIGAAARKDHHDTEQGFVSDREFSKTGYYLISPE